MEEKKNKLAAAGLFILAGGIMGAGVALLFAPQSGRRTRRDIARSAAKIKARTDETVEDLTDTISDLVDSIGDKTEDLLDKGKLVAHGARKDLLRLIEEGAATLEKFGAKLRGM